MSGVRTVAIFVRARSDGAWHLARTLTATSAEVACAASPVVPIACTTFWNPAPLCPSCRVAAEERGRWP